MNKLSLCPIGVPLLTITSTHPDFAWLVNYIETLISCTLWQPITSATIAHEYKKILESYAIKTNGSVDGVQWQGHDFSMRGMSSVETAIGSGMAHLLSFTGTDTIPAIYSLEKYYNATGLIRASVPATEHSIESMNAMGTMEGELFHTLRLLELYPNGILSKVSDTTDIWSYITQVLPKCKHKIINRDGKLVIRPDIGNPVDIICGLNTSNVKTFIGNTNEITFGYTNVKSNSPEAKGVIELLWDVFGGTINEQGYKVLDPHIGCIYGDGIGLHNLEEICSRLESKGFASINVIFGFGSYGYQYQTRDTFGFAMKATYGEVLECDNSCMMDHPDSPCKECIKPVGREIFKDPITDDGTKKSKKGLLKVDFNDYDHEGKFVCLDQQTLEQEKEGYLETVFLDGVLTKIQTLEEIRERLNN